MLPLPWGTHGPGVGASLLGRRAASARWSGALLALRLGSRRGRWRSAAGSLFAGAKFLPPAEPRRTFFEWEPVAKGESNLPARRREDLFRPLRVRSRVVSANSVLARRMNVGGARVLTRAFLFSLTADKCRAFAAGAYQSGEVERFRLRRV